MKTIAQLNRENIVNKQIHNFLNTSPSARTGLCTFGVEIEFQAENSSNKEAEIESYCENADPLDYIGEYDLSSEWNKIDNSWRIIAALWAGYDEGDFEDFLDRNNWFTCSYEDVMDRIRESAEEYINENCECHDICTEYELVDDQSVSGGEVRTRGGVSFDELIVASDHILDDIESGGGEIDDECSAHIHVKLGDIHHRFGEGNLHRHIMEYLVLHREELPERVLSRLAGGGNRWIVPSVTHNDKYQWVHFHRQGTIEFRLFGNIDDSDDIETCARLAVAALAYAYEQLIERGEFQLTKEYITEFSKREFTEDWGLFDPAHQYTAPIGPHPVRDINGIVLPNYPY
jgi:hypothetical protein